MILSIGALLALSLCGLFLTYNLIPSFTQQFIKAGIYGIDLNKPKSKDNVTKVPEATGVISGCVFLILTFLMVPVSFSHFVSGHQDRSEFPHVQLVSILSALLSIACMLLLGFADDVLDLRWRHKLLLPTLSSLPVLMVYFVTTNKTGVSVPIFLGHFFTTGYVDLGIFYYVYMGMLAVFCTNAINIYSGINGLEVGQSIVIASSVALFNLIELESNHDSNLNYHQLSLYFLIPYLGTSLALLKHNWYPSKVFAGDTFCYFSGMTLAVVAILGHFSKTLLLFFIPQIMNFIYSLPQLFRFLPCPRHRLPKLHSNGHDLTFSTFQMEMNQKPNLIGSLCLLTLERLRLIEKYESNDDDVKNNIKYNNLTLVNLFLIYFGPMDEEKVTVCLLCFQIFTSCIAFFIRYPLTWCFYG